MSEGPSTSERLSSAYKRLAASAEVLNAASDEFSKPILELETALQELNVGLATWKKIVGGDDHEYQTYWQRDVGYATVGDKWGLAIRTVEGCEYWDRDTIKEWLFKDAPRSYRIEAFDKLPDLLEELIKNSDKTAKKLKEKAVEARELAAALKQAADEVKQQKEAAKQQKKERP